MPLHRAVTRVKLLPQTEAWAAAARKDGGFSPLTVSWSLEGFDVLKKAKAVGMSDAEARELDEFRQRLRDEIAALARP